MRLMSILTALLVTVSLYFLVFERDAVLSLAEADDAPETEAIAAQQDDVARVSVVALHSMARNIENAVILRGETEAARQVEVRAETSGQIISEPLRKGTFVEAGDLLCKLDPGTRQSILDEAEARLDEARARLPEAQARVPEARARQAEAEARLTEAEARVIEAQSRLQEAEINENAAARLSEGGFASETRVANAEATLSSARAGITSGEASVEGARAGIAGAGASVEGAIAAVESARAAIRSAEAGVAAAERELERLTITAPFRGLLETDTAELGALLQPGSACATVVQLDPMHLVGFVPEGDVAMIEPGADATAMLASGRSVSGTVSFVARTADSTTRTFRVEVTVPNPDLGLRDGQTAEIVVAAPNQRAHLLPQSSLTLDDEGALGVRVVTADQTAQFKPVSILRDTVDGIWIAGLDESESVIVVGQEFVTDGVALRVALREPGEELLPAVLQVETGQ